ncbi:ribonuclease P protein component [Campylobacter sputorum]|uniref:ribonuclease P protein component n=1 Tax=Campylobacter sputorum TaxID=206 RepID=UPI00053BFC85|nr:ribonuclease P protein component [Campylobacter sputorum]
MKKFSSLSKTSEFSNVYKNAKKWHCECMVVLYLGTEFNKFAVVANKKVGCAVIRNRTKRVIRAAFADISDTLKNGIYVIIAKPGLNEIPFLQIKKNLKWSFKKLEALTK